MTAQLLHMSLDPTLVTLAVPALHIKNEQATSRLEHASNFSKSLPLEFPRQMVHHQTAENHVERVVRKGELFDQTDLEIDRNFAPGSFAASNGNHLRRSVNAAHPASFANTR